MENNEEEIKYQEIKAWVMTNEYMSLSRIQRECSVGFNRAGRIFKRLQDEGIIAKEEIGHKGYPVLAKNKPIEEPIIEKANKEKKTEVVEVILCRKCGARMDKKFKYCPYCGTSVIDEPKEKTDETKHAKVDNIKKSNKRKWLWALTIIGIVLIAASLQLPAISFCIKNGDGTYPLIWLLKLILPLSACGIASLVVGIIELRR